MTLFLSESTPACVDRTTTRTPVASVMHAAIEPVMMATAALSRHWRRRKNERILQSLPAELRKDIGYRCDLDGYDV